MKKKNDTLKNVVKTVTISSLLIKSINEEAKISALEQENLKLKKALQNKEYTQDKSNKEDVSNIDIFRICWKLIVCLFLVYIAASFLGMLFGFDVPAFLNKYLGEKS